MPDHKDTRPTPPSGIPSASLLIEATPSRNSVKRPTQESRADVPEPMSEAQEILVKLDGLKTDLTLQIGDLAARHEHRLESIEKKQDAFEKETAKRFHDATDLISKVAGAATNAADVALKAQRTASETQSQAQAMIESALRMQSVGLAAMVDTAVKNSFEPIAAQVQKLAEHDEAQSKDISKSNEALGAVVNELGIEDKVELGREVHPGEKRPQRTLRKIDRRITLVSVLGSVAIILECLVKIFHL